jgi:hypothetical protein
LHYRKKQKNVQYYPALPYKIVWYALGSVEALKYEDQTPSGEFRFKLLSEHPVAEALHFENVLDDVIEHVIGWCQKMRRPKKNRGTLWCPESLAASC